MQSWSDHFKAGNSDENVCWIDRRRGAMRLSYMLAYDSSPAILYHTCENAHCIRPSHLAEGVAPRRVDAVMNARLDAWENPPKMGRPAILSTQDGLDAHARHKAGARIADLAAEYGVTERTMRNTIKRALNETRDLPPVEERRGRFLTRTQAIKAVKHLERGDYSQAQLARLFDVSRPTIGHIAQGKTWKDVPRDGKPERHKPGPKVELSQLRRMIELREAGWKLKEIAEVVGVNRTTVMRRTASVRKPRPYVRITPEHEARVLEMRAAGAGIARIARDVGISRGSVSRILERSIG